MCVTELIKVTSRTAKGIQKGIRETDIDAMGEGAQTTLRSDNPLGELIQSRRALAFTACGLLPRKVQIQILKGRTPMGQGPGGVTPRAAR